MANTTNSVDSKVPHSPGPVPAAGHSAPAFADAVLHELDERYDRGWWQEGWRLGAIIVAAITLAGIAAAGIAATSIAHHRRGRFWPG